MQRIRVLYVVVKNSQVTVCGTIFHRVPDISEGVLRSRLMAVTSCISAEKNPTYKNIVRVIEWVMPNNPHRLQFLKLSATINVIEGLRQT
jgi:hypothetical protein